MPKLREITVGSETGQTLVSTMIDMALIALSALAVAGLIAYNRIGETRIKRGVQGDDAMVSSATGLQEMNYFNLYNFCSAKGALNTTRVPICGLPGGQLSSAANVQPGTDPLTGLPKVVDVLRDWNGDAIATGRVCIELVSCVEQAGGRMMSVTLRGIWADPSSPGGQLIPMPKLFVFRKAK